MLIKKFKNNTIFCVSYLVVFLFFSLLIRLSCFFPYFYFFKQKKVNYKTISIPYDSPIIMKMTRKDHSSTLLNCKSFTYHGWFFRHLSSYNEWIYPNFNMLLKVQSPLLFLYQRCQKRSSSFHISNRPNNIIRKILWMPYFRASNKRHFDHLESLMSEKSVYIYINYMFYRNNIQQRQQ